VAEGEHRQDERGWPRAAVALLGVAVAAMVVRCLGFEWVFVGDEVFFPPGDAQYHLRRSLYTFVNWPSVLLWDAYINYPDGAAVAWPPLFDFALGTVGRLLVADARQFEYVAAWAPPVFGALTTIPIYLAARLVGSRAEAILAVCFFALFPMSVNFTRIGNADHHCAVAFIGAWLLLLCMKAVSCESESRRPWLLLGVGLTAARAALLFTWHGSLLYLALTESTLLLGAALLGRRAVFAVTGLSALATAVVVAPFVLTPPTPLGGPYSAIALSRLHLVAVVAKFPLFAFTGRAPVRAAELSWGYFAYLIPVAPLVALWTARRRGRMRPAALVLALWAAFFGALAMVQRRYGNDLGPAASVVFALLLSGAGHRAAGLLGRGPRVAGVLAAALGIALLAPPLRAVYLPHALGSIRALRGADLDGDRVEASVRGSLTRFCQQLRRVTPETSGFFDPEQAPEYGVVAHANLGHAIQYVGRRGTPTDPFWAFIGPENWDRAFGLLQAETEAEGLALAEQLRARYVVTMPSAAAGSLEGRLHQRDGLAGSSLPRIERFRLVAEAPRGGRPIGDIFGSGPRGVIPYKLFEIVPGAVLEAKAAPGTEVVARLALVTPLGRRIPFIARATADREGIARLRVAYPSQGGDSGEPAAPVRAAGTYRVQVGDEWFEVTVSLAQVRRGARVAVAPGGA
jgi:hypothetical protein